jgi:hypothetical protein
MIAGPGGRRHAPRRAQLFQIARAGRPGVSPVTSFGSRDHELRSGEWVTESGRTPWPVATDPPASAVVCP